MTEVKETDRAVAFDWTALPQASAEVPAFPPLAHPIEIILRGEAWRAIRGCHGRRRRKGTRIPLDMDGIGLALEFADDPLPFVVGGHGGVPDLSDLSAAEHNLILHHLSHGPLEALSALVGAPVTIGTDRNPADERRLPFGLIGPGDVNLPVTLLGPAAAIERVAALLPVADDRLDETIGELPIAIGLHGRAFSLPVEELEALAPRDVLIAPVGWSDTDGLRVRLGANGDELPVLRERQVLRSRPGRFAPPVLSPIPETFDMTDTIAATSQAAEADADNDRTEAASSGLGKRRAGLSVSVSLELDRATITIAALSALEEGGVLPFEATPGGPVRLLANGAPFAEGELVRVDERIGLRVAKIL